VKAYNATLDFIKTKNPHYEVTNIFPSLVMGKNELASTTAAAGSGSNVLMMGVLLGEHAPMPYSGTTVHVEDVAFVHVKALDPEIPGNEKFATNSNGIGGTVWEEANEIVKRLFPEAVRDGILKADGTCAAERVRFDARRTEEVMGFRFRGWEEQGVSQARWYIDLAKREKGRANGA